MFGLFKKKSPTAVLATQGKPIHINESPRSNKTICRHLTRIANCKQALLKEKGKKGKQRKNELLAEIEKRELMLKVHDINAPQDIDALRELATKYSG